MTKVIGIDLGTTFSAIASLDDLGNPEVIASIEDNRKITASAIYIDGKNVIVGDKAFNYIKDEPKKVILQTKREMENDVVYSIDQGKWTNDNDLVDATIKAAQKGKHGETYNVGNGKEISVNLIASLIGGSKVRVPKRPGEPDRSLADISKIKKQFSWKPKISINEGIKMLLNDINNWKEAPVWTPETIKEATKSWFKLLSKS